MGSDTGELPHIQAHTRRVFHPFCCQYLLNGAADPLNKQYELIMAATTDYSCTDVAWTNQPRVIVSFLGLRLCRGDLSSRVVWDPHRYLTLPSPQRR